MYENRIKILIPNFGKNGNSVKFQFFWKEQRWGWFEQIG
jgi:hypothetical protein